MRTRVLIEVATLPIVAAALLLLAVYTTPIASARGQAIGSLLASLAIGGAVLLTRRHRLFFIGELVLVGTVVAFLGLLAASGPRGFAFLDAKEMLTFDPPRVAPPFGLPIYTNSVANLLVPAPVAAAALATTRGASGVRRITWWVACFTGLLLVAASGSRASLVAVLVGLATALVIRGGRRIGVIAAAGMALGGLLALATGLHRAMSVEARLALWEHVADRLPSWMPLGAYGGFAHGQIRGEAFEELGRALNVHNAYLQTLVDFGVPGVVALGVTVGVSAAAATRLVRLGDERERTIGVASLSALVAIAVVGIAESILSTSFLYGDRLVTVVSPVPFLVLAAPLGVSPSTMRPGDQGHPGRRP